jgi:DNA repair exonuclease SbcCD ATPase subunit
MSQLKIASLTERLRDLNLPDNVLKTGLDMFESFWAIAEQHIQTEIEKSKTHYYKKESELLQKQQRAVDIIEQLNKELAAIKQQNDLLERENETLHTEVDRKIGELAGYQTTIARLEEKDFARLHEMKRLSEEVGKFKENQDLTQKKLDEANRQAQADFKLYNDMREELKTQTRLKENFQEQVKRLTEENGVLQERFKAEFGKSSAAQATVEEIKVAIKKGEVTIQELKHDYESQRDALNAEQKIRLELERKAAVLETQLANQETVSKETITKLEQELSLQKSEVMNLRTRLIKSEGALEREKKAVERLETKLTSSR